MGYGVQRILEIGEIFEGTILQKRFLCHEYFFNCIFFSFYLQESKGYDFESETDTETIAKLVKYMYDNQESQDTSFTTLVERVIQQLVLSHTLKDNYANINHEKLSGN